MCDRCASGLWFFGIAEPQAPMLESYRAALVAGWTPHADARPGASLHALRNVDADPVAFIAKLRDRIAAAPRSIRLTRWMWDELAKPLLIKQKLLKAFDDRRRLG